jgi:hypothetical protein
LINLPGLIIVAGINECESASVGVGSSGVGEGDSVAVATSAGVAEAGMTGKSVAVAARVAGTGSVPKSIVTPGILHASMTNTRIKLNVIMELFFFMVLSSQSIIILFGIPINRSLRLVVHPLPDRQSSGTIAYILKISNIIPEEI